jgi:hypothetical protein
MILKKKPPRTQVHQRISPRRHPAIAIGNPNDPTQINTKGTMYAPRKQVTPIKDLIASANSAVPRRGGRFVSTPRAIEETAPVNRKQNISIKTAMPGTTAAEMRLMIRLSRDDFEDSFEFAIINWIPVGE